MSGGWEGNRRSGVALATPQGLEEQDEQPHPHALLWSTIDFLHLLIQYLSSEKGSPDST